MLQKFVHGAGQRSKLAVQMRSDLLAHPLRTSRDVDALDDTTQQQRRRKRLVAFDMFTATCVQVKPSESSPHSPSAELQHPDHPLGHLRSSRLPAMHHCDLTAMSGRPVAFRPMIDANLIIVLCCSSAADAHLRPVEHAGW